MSLIRSQDRPLQNSPYEHQLSSLSLSSSPHKQFFASDMGGGDVIRGGGNLSPSKPRVGSVGEIAGAVSPMSSPSKKTAASPAPRERKGSFWDGLFQVDVMYQKSRK